VINLVYPELQFSSAGLDRLSETERQEPISHLGLTARTHNVLVWRKAETLGQLVDILRGERGIGIVRNFGRKSHEELVHAVLALSEAINSDGAVDWDKYAKLARKEFVGMRVSEAARDVAQLQAPEFRPKRHAWPRPFGKIPEEIANQPLQSLPFSNRAFQGLKNMGVTTIGEATRICATDLMKLRNVGRNTIQEIYQTILTAVAPLTEDSIVRDDPAFASPQFPLVPERSEGMADQFYTDFFRELPLIIKKNEGTQEEYILRLRLFCPLGKAKTLQNLGNKFGITRERIRQKEAELIHMLTAALFYSKYTYMQQGRKHITRFGKVKFRIQPKLQKIFANLPERLNKGLPEIVKLSEWTARLAKILCVSPDLIAHHHTFWLNLLKFKTISIKSVHGFKNEDLVTKMKESGKRVSEILSAIARFNYVLLCSPLGVTEDDIIKKINTKKSTENCLSICFNLSSLPILKTKNAIFPIYKKSVKLSSIDLEQALLRVLKNNGGHIKTRLLVYKMQEEFPFINNIKETTISNIIAKSKFISSIGKTGYCKIRIINS